MHTIKQLNYQKNSFIFLETIVSLLVVSVIVGIFFKTTYNNDTDKKFQKINHLSNELKKSNYENFNLSTKIIKIKKDLIEEEVLVKKIIYNNEVKLIKYETK